MTMKKTLSAFGRTHASGRAPQPRMLGLAPVPAPPAADPCSVQAWYEDPPLDATGKPTGGMKTSTMAYLVMGVPAAVAGVLGAVLWEKHRVGGAVLGAVAGFAGGAAVDTYQFSQWKAAGGARHTKGSCDAAGAPPAAAAPPADGEPTPES